MAPVRILLTSDDGPDDGALGGHNRTKHVYWDLVSSDPSSAATGASVCAHLAAETSRLATGAVDLICLLHDVCQVTADHLADFIDAIAGSVRATGHTPIFVADRVEAELVMDRKSRRGTDTPCAADSMG